MSSDPVGTDEPGMIPAECSSWKQGDVFDCEQIHVTHAACTAVSVEAPDGVAMVSQTCDVVLTKRPYVQVAKVVRMPPEGGLNGLRLGKRPNYVHLPELGDDAFADLAVVATLHKSVLAGAKREVGVCGIRDERRFAAGIARWFGRFPFPDDISDAMKPLRDMCESAAPRQASPLGQVLGDLVELRAEAEWTADPVEVTLVFVVEPGQLPTWDDDSLPMEPPTELSVQFSPLFQTPKRAINELANSLLRGVSGSDRYWIWRWLAEACAALCDLAAGAQGDVNSGGSASTRGAAPTFSGIVVSADEYPLSSVRMSELVDLAHLSDPVSFE